LKFIAGAWLSWLERLLHTQEVSGSNPLAPTINLVIYQINQLVFKLYGSMDEEIEIAEG
jgi:hypothetical protein